MRADPSGWVYRFLHDENIWQAVCYFEDPMKAKEYVENGRT